VSVYVKFKVSIVTVLSLLLFSPRRPKEEQALGNAFDVGYKPLFLRSVSGVR